MEDLEPPSALSIKPNDSISYALMTAFERDYTHLTVVDPQSKALLGYVNIPRLRTLLEQGAVRDTDAVQQAMQRFRRKGSVYKVITLDTPLEELEDFFAGAVDGEGQTAGAQDFAVVTDAARKFVLGVATKEDLQEFVRRRPSLSTDALQR